jgi:hypothetical protein
MVLRSTGFGASMMQKVNAGFRGQSVGRKKEVDSRVHWFGQEVGFCSLLDSVLDDNLKAVEERIWHIIHMPKSAVWRVECRGNFEAYVLKAHHNDPYAAFLNKIADSPPGAVPTLIAKPTQLLVQAYLCYMSDEGDTMQTGVEGRGNAFNSIRNQLGGVSGTLKEFGEDAGLKKNAVTAKLMEHLKGSNNPKRAKTFDLEDHLPLLFKACFDGPVYKQWHTKVKIWTRFLVGITLIARSADVTEYCPEFDGVEYPEDPMDYTTENIPKSLVLVFKNWKGRPEWHK